MEIKDIKERLEGSYRLIRIRRIKLGFYMLELILGLVLGFAVAALLGMRFDPFFFPVDTFSFIMLIMLLVISAESIYFKGLELRYTKNKSRKFLLARNAIRKSLAVISVSGICVMLLLLPYSQERMEERHSLSSGTYTVGPGETLQNAPFACQDKLGLTRASHIRITLDDLDNRVFIRVESLGNTVEPYTPQPALSYDWHDLAPYAGTQGDVYVVVENTGYAGNITFSYSVTSDVSPLVRMYFPVMGLLFIIIQCVSISVMYPIRETYASSSIYSKKYVPPKDTGEYSVSEIKLTKKEKEEEEALLERALDIEHMPAPPKPAAQTQAQRPKAEPAEMARVKGRVDEGLIEEPDVECSSCGEMNSAHAAMCFSCGAALAAREKAAVDPAAYLRKGESFANAGRFEDALGCYDEALKHDSMNEITLLRKGEALHKLGKWGNAIQYVNTALKVNPNNVQTLVLKAKILEERDRLDKSLEIYAQILALDPENRFAKSRMERFARKPAAAPAQPTPAEEEDAEDVLERFMEVPGIGLARATSLYEAGYTSFAMLKAATEDQLAKVKGISKGVAKKIRKGLDGF